MTLIDGLILFLIAFILWIMIDAWLQKFKKKPSIPKSQRAIYYELMNELGYNNQETREALSEIKTYEEIVRVNREIRRGLENYKIKKENVNNSKSRS